MIPHIHERLLAWAAWLNKPTGLRGGRGWPSRSSEQRGLETRNYATCGRRAHRRGTPEEPLGPPTFPPANVKQSRGVTEIPSPRNTLAEATDVAVAQMPEYLSKAVKLIYLNGYTNTLGADQMRVSVATFKAYINVAHGWLDGHFCREGKMGLVNS